MHINTARTFIEIVETGSFLKAAEKLHVTASTISMRINSLEDSLGQKLFMRNRSGVQLTPAGLKFMKYAVDMLKTWQKAQNEIALPEGISAYLHIGIEYNFPSDIVLNWLSNTRQSSQNIAIGLEYDSFSELSHRINSGQLDIALTYRPQISTNTEIMPLFEETLVLVSKEKRELMYWDPDYIYVDYGEQFKEQHHNAYPIDETPKMTLQSGDLAMDYIKLHGGSGYLRFQSCREQLELEQLFLVEEAPIFKRSCYAVFSKGLEDNNWFSEILGYFALLDSN